MLTRELSPAQARRRTDPERWQFQTTAELEAQLDSLGQTRAVEAIKFGLGIDHEGYNIFALGPTGLGKHTVVQGYLEERAKGMRLPNDWCYVYNFDEPHKPWALELPAGMGAEFRDEMLQAGKDLLSTLAAAFESDEYQARQQALEQEYAERQAAALKAVQQAAEKDGIALLRTPAGLAFAPVRDGEVVSREEIEKLSAQEQDQLGKRIEELQEQLQKSLRQVPAWQREARERQRQLDSEVAAVTVKDIYDDLSYKYAWLQEVTAYLTAVRADIVKNPRQLLTPAEETSQAIELMFASASLDSAAGSSVLRRYQVNLLVDNGSRSGAPVVYVDNPTFENLVGRVEHVARMGALLTDFQLIKPGALHLANGGYLIMDARKLLQQTYAWEGLKRALQAHHIRIESVPQMLSAVSTVSLEPEPIPLDVKVAIVGERQLYYALHALDPDFAELFKVSADFEEVVDRTPDNELLFARLMASMVQNLGLLPFDRQAVAQVIEQAARMVGDSQRLSTHRRSIADVLIESNHFAQEAGQTTVSAIHVRQAIDAQMHRVDRMRERSYEAISRGTILIDTSGAQVGQINGLSVLQLGDLTFGRPSRITARVRLGKGEVLDIEREVELGGPIHSKGVLILTGFLGSRYAGLYPLSLSASLVFEQSYNGVEGDSASSAELYALLSAIAEVPIKQHLAVTGSVNQHGLVQAIGGVNEKIEGFFDVCKARGLTGDQGVLIPASNVQDLMLRPDVVDAIAAGEFHVYPVETIDQGIALLTGLEAGERAQDGSFPHGSVNHLVHQRLEDLAQRMHALTQGAKGSAT